MSLSPAAQTIFEKAKRQSEDGLTEMRKLARECFVDDDSIIIGVNGSYARREATQGSDVDLFFLFDRSELSDVTEKQSTFRETLQSAGFEMPSSGGVFDAPLSISTLRHTIGGQEDDNKQITRRMLLLLEGEWIHNQHDFRETRTRLLTQYVSEDIRSDQISLFLLNDIIRYWRTICVDFEHKVQKKNKDRAIRLIKLRFSRMMLFLAGVLAVSETFQLERSQKITKLEELLSMPAYDRAYHIAGENTVPALELYSEFLASLDDEAVRSVLSQPSPAGESTDAFIDLRDKAQRFRSNLIEVLHGCCSDPNPTFNALLL